jgi:hypothetical protein
LRCVIDLINAGVLEFLAVKRWKPNAGPYDFLAKIDSDSSEQDGTASASTAFMKPANKRGFDLLLACVDSGMISFAWLLCLKLDIC